MTGTRTFFARWVAPLAVVLGIMLGGCADEGDDTTATSETTEETTDSTESYHDVRHIDHDHRPVQHGIVDEYINRFVHDDNDRRLHDVAR